MLINKIKKQIISSLMVITLATGFTFAAEVPADEEYGAKSIDSYSNLTLEEMLVYAIEDEYLARAEYNYLIDTYGVGTPLTNIVKAEETHVNLLEGLFQTYGYDMPLDDAKAFLNEPESLANVYELGVEAEIVNIDMYAQFLSNGDLPSDVVKAFESLQSASESHLEAFQRQVDTNRAGNQQNSPRFGQRGNGR